MRRWLVALLALALFCTPVLAVNPDEVLDDPVLEQRARDISANLRCLVCQNQSIDDSDADLARDLRLLVRERLVAGDSDAEVRDFVVARYGEFVLLNPVVGWHTVALWGTMPIVLLIAGVIIILRVRGRPQVEETRTDMNTEEQAALDSLHPGERS